MHSRERIRAETNDKHRNTTCKGPYLPQGHSHCLSTYPHTRMTNDVNMKSMNYVALSSEWSPFEKTALDFSSRVRATGRWPRGGSNPPRWWSPGAHRHSDLGWSGMTCTCFFLSWPKWLIQTWQNPKFLVFRLIYNLYTSVYICLKSQHGTGFSFLSEPVGSPDDFSIDTALGPQTTSVVWPMPQEASKTYMGLFRGYTPRIFPKCQLTTGFWGTSILLSDKPAWVSQTWFTGTFKGQLHLSYGTTHGFQFRFTLKPIHSQAMIVRAASVHTVVPWRSTLRLGRWSQRLKIAAGTRGHQLASPAMNPHLFLDGKFRWNAKVITWWSMWAKLDGHDRLSVLCPTEDCLPSLEGILFF